MGSRTFAKAQEVYDREKIIRFKNDPSHMNLRNFLFPNGIVR
jgi:hypothetical protein